MGDQLAVEAARIAAVKGHVQLAYPIENTDRAVGTRLAGEVAAMVGDAEPPGSLEVRLSGTAGQSLGAFLVPGVTMRLGRDRQRLRR